MKDYKYVRNAPLWWSYTEEQIREFYKSSKDRQDFLFKLGYKCYRKKLIKDIQKEYPFVDFSHCTAGVFQDITGKKFGRLTVLERDYSKTDKDLYWLCQCECGNKVSVRGTSLRKGTVKSCGCLLIESRYNKIEDLSGRKFGHWTVLERDYSDKKRVRYFCKCDCGNSEIRSVLAEHLRSGDSTSCGCIRSKGEEKIGIILSGLNISYKKEYSFSDLRGKGHPLRFDFAIFKNEKLFALIEYQGIQHYKSCDALGGKEQFKITVVYDNMKKEYCNQKNIPLLEISYKDFNSLDEKYLKNKLIEMGFYNV